MSGQEALARDIAAKAETAFQATCASRDRFWSSVGDVEPDVISYLISPGLRGGPYWPSMRQAFRVVRRTSSVIVATDGLADPFTDCDPCSNGFEMELFVETPSLAAEVAAPPGVEAFKSSWAFALVENVARLVADNGGIRGDLDELGAISAELPGMVEHPAVPGQIPPRFISDSGSLGILIGVPATTVPALIEDTPNATVRIASVVLLTAAELAHVAAGGAAARHRVLDHLAATTGHLCDLDRASAV